MRARVQMALFVAGMVALGGCSNSRNAVATGTVRLALSLPNGTTLNSVSWQIRSSGGAVLRAGTINTSDPGATPSVDTSCPASTGDTVVMTGTTSDGTGCSGTSMPFNVAAGGTVQVGLTIVCGGGTPVQNNGSVIVNSTVVQGDNCPVLTSWVASPLQTSFAAQIDVAATATDADATDVLTYAWTATGGSFVSPSSPSTKYNCTGFGPQTLTITVSDNHAPIPCTAVVTIPNIECIEPECGDGRVEPGEQCDPTAPSDPNRNNCSPITCTLICGNGRIDPGEQCDPPQAGKCSSTCQFAPVCGDGIIAGPPFGTETCDPPMADVCDATCHLVPGTLCQTCEQSSIFCDPTLLSVPGASPGAFGCSGFTGAAQSACLALLDCVRTAGCMVGDGPSDCLCGPGVDPVQCATGAVPLSGVCLSQYNAALAAGPPGTVFTLFTDPRSPIGIADNLVQCDVDASCTACGVVTTQPPPPSCGNHIVETGEQCDPPTLGICSATCQLIPAMCGDGFVQAGEQCDPPNPGFCGPTCQLVPARCGDGFVQAGEQCDPPQPGVCSPTCQLIVGPSCGNHVLEGGEQCDPPQPNVCTATCQFVPAVCGDDFVQHGEECDPPNGTTCGPDCMLIGNCTVCEMTSPACDPTLVTPPGATSGFGCDGFTGALQNSCAVLLDCVRTNHCASGDDPTPCYCGVGVDPVACATGAATPSGVCLNQYNAALAGGPSGTIATLFTDPSSPIGVADNLVSCDVDTPCACGQ
jgi:hypothetical protein